MFSSDETLVILFQISFGSHFVSGDISPSHQQRFS